MQARRFIYKCTSAKKAPYAIKGVRQVMGTFVTIIVVSPDPDHAQQSIKLAFHEIDRIHDLMSVYKAGSEVYALNRHGFYNNVSPETQYVIRRANDISELTEGAFDITLLPVLRMWEKVAQLNTLPQDAELGKKMELVGYKNIVMKGNRVKFREKSMAITLAGIAKGYAVDKAVETLKKNQIKHALVNGGGDIRALGGKTDDIAWKIGLRHPLNRSKIFTCIKLRDKAIATSGSYQRAYNDLIHLKGGRPAQGLLSSTIITEKAIDADVLATAFFILGGTKGMELLNGFRGTRAIYVDNEGHIRNERSS